MIVGVDKVKKVTHYANLILPRTQVKGDDAKFQPQLHKLYNPEDEDEVLSSQG